MLELVQLSHLIAVSKHSTISAAAESLHLSQPALTRSLQRLEAELGVALFDRKRNRAVLNEVGAMAVAQAQGVLNAVTDMAAELRQYAARLSTISIGSCGPAPMWDLAAELAERFPDRALSTESGDTESLIEGLNRGSYRLILTDHPVEQPGLLCRKYTQEQLCVALPPDHPMSSRASLRLEELGEASVLAYRDLGVWKHIPEKNPRLHYLVQSDRATLSELVEASSLPCISSNLTAFRFLGRSNRVRVPLSDAEASVTFYLCARESDRALFELLC